MGYKLSILHSSLHYLHSNEDLNPVWHALNKLYLDLQAFNGGFSLRYIISRTIHSHWEDPCSVAETRAPVPIMLLLWPQQRLCLHLRHLARIRWISDKLRGLMVYELYNQPPKPKASPSRCEYDPFPLGMRFISLSKWRKCFPAGCFSSILESNQNWWYSSLRRIFNTLSLMAPHLPFA